MLFIAQWFGSASWFRPMREFRWIRSEKELEELAPQWSALWKEDPLSTPFQSPEWLVPWWHFFGEDLRSVGIFGGDRLKGLLPFYVYRDPQTGERQLLPLGVGTTDYLDGVFATDCTAAEVEKALEFVCSEGDWDAVYVSQLRPGSRLLQAFEQMNSGEQRFETLHCSRMPAVALSELPQKIRRNAMYYRNRALRAGPLELEVANASNCAGIFDVLVRLHAERWKNRGEPGVFSDERMVRWHCEALPRLERAGLLRLCSLRLNGEIIGVLYSLLDPADRPERIEYFYLPAFSIRHADLRPGTLLTALAVEHAAREGVRTIDMLRGDEDYKKMWHTQRTPTFGFVRYREAFRDRMERAGELAA